MTDTLSQGPIGYFEKTIERAIQTAIEEQVRRKMPEIVGAACSCVMQDLSTLINYERFGFDLRITILNAYKPGEEK